MKKVIDSFLDTLLVLGAIACILTIGGGKWLAASYTGQDSGMPVVYPLMDSSLPQNQSAADKTGSDGKAIPCPAFGMSSSAWAEGYLLRMNSMGYVQDQNQDQARQIVCR